MNTPLFGTAGASESFKAMGYKSSAQVPEYTAAMGLDAFEYQCGRGVRLGQELAKTIRAGAEVEVAFTLSVNDFMAAALKTVQTGCSDAPCYIAGQNAR